VLANSGFSQLPSGLWVPGVSAEAQRKAQLDELERQGIPRRAAIASAIKATLAGDSIVVTPGTGATVATHTVNSKEHQVVMVADEHGHILGSRDIYIAMIPSQVHVAAANTVHWDLFNADAALLVRVMSILQIPNITTAVTGVVFDWLLERTTAVGTGGTVITPWLPDTSQTALDADVTCRSKPTGGATASTDLRNYSLSSEETNTATIQIASLGGLELIPDALLPVTGRHGILLRQNQGLRCVQVTNSAAGNTGWLITFTVE
jgi:hypothetical protein